MNNNLVQITLIGIIIVSYFVTLFIGIFIGNMIKNNSQRNSETPVSFLRNTKKEYNIANHDVSIDDTKVVLGVSTEGMEKKFTNIAEEKMSKNDISQSVNKLKNMKGK